jgi:phospholipid/cholesterol/gamma-HCH transport system substrate-binding protein
VRSRAQTVRLGIFVATAAGLLLALLIVLSGSALLARRDRYTILFEETVSGLEVGAAVKLLGVRVGRIESYRVISDGSDKVEVEVSLDHGTPIRRNAKAALSGSGLTGLLFVEITGGTADAPLVEPGGRIPAGPSLLGTLTGKAENIAIKTEEVINRVLALTAEQNLTNMQRTLDNLQEATFRLRNVLESLDGAAPSLVEASEKLDPVLSGIDGAAAAVRDAAAGGREVATNLESLTREGGPVTATLTELQRTLETSRALLGGDNAAQLSADVRAALQSFTEAMHSLSTVVGASGADIRSVSSSLRDAAEHLEEFARSIRENPSLLIRSTRAEE